MYSVNSILCNALFLRRGSLYKVMRRRLPPITTFLCDVAPPPAAPQPIRSIPRLHSFSLDNKTLIIQKPVSAHHSANVVSN
ncbi:hypothetical protein F7725_027135, partial [Dissostichus mawsoni]